MTTKKQIRLVPGPTSVSKEVLEAHSIDFGSADLEESFFLLYKQTIIELNQIMLCQNSKTVILSGEANCALWSGMRSCILPGDRVISISTGVFGSGISDMAKACGADVRKIEFPINSTVDEDGWKRIEEEVTVFKPKMITIVHCETPSGTLNDVKRLGQIKMKIPVHQKPLLYVDAVSSIGGAELRVDEWGLDIVLGGSQKCLSCPPSVCWLALSSDAWRTIESVSYRGYDALLP